MRLISAVVGDILGAPLSISSSRAVFVGSSQSKLQCVCVFMVIQELVFQFFFKIGLRTTMELHSTEEEDATGFN